MESNYTFKFYKLLDPGRQNDIELKSIPDK